MQAGGLLFTAALLTSLSGLAGLEATHTNNWAVLVCTSRYWFNYRHVANTLSIYHTVKQLGIPDSQIILMLADDMPCNARNSLPGEVFRSRDHKLNLYGEEVEVDYRGLEVTVESFMRLLTGRTLPGLPSSKMLNTDQHSNILMYLSGHGGDEFLKFQDAEEISSKDLADAFEEMHIKGRYHEILFMVDTCQAATLANEIYSPNILSIASSLKGENSYADNADEQLGLSIMDRFTSAALDFFEAAYGASLHDSRGSLQSATLANLMSTMRPGYIHSTPAVNTQHWDRPLQEVPVTDFFASVLKVELTQDTYLLEGAL